MTPDWIKHIIPTELTVESRVARRALTGPIDVHTDATILAKTLVCNTQREGEGVKAGKFAPAA